MPSSRLSAPLFVTVLLLVAAGCTSGNRSAEPLPSIRLDPAVAARAADSIAQQTSIELAGGLELSLWAVDELAPDAIALAFDETGRAFISRTHRLEHSEFDIRGHQDWTTASMALQSVEDRRAFLRETLAEGGDAEGARLPDLNNDSLYDWRDLTVETEEVYRLEDTDSDGVADVASLVATGFDTEVTDVAGALLPYKGDLFLGVAPDLWRLEDPDGDGTFDARTSLSHGYQVHIGFGGHNMSGLTVGPDGRLYWSVGDIGFNVVDAEGRRWAYPNQGAILRANLDGSGFEVFAAGLRNTHEFVFDAYGNLISVDNDGDHPGENERLVYLIDGSDSGWRINWQFGKYTDPDNNAYKVWMDEEMYKPRFEGQAAYFLPPVANYHSGPAGMAYNPGTALDSTWQDRFFVAEFTGTPSRSRVFAFRLEPEGAGFRFAGEEEVTRGILTTGVEFGPDGALYLADWIEGWTTKDRGRIWKVDTDSPPSAVRQETQALLAASFAERPADSLYVLLRHADQRVRQKAQFELVRRGEEGAGALLAAAVEAGDRLARLHAIWGLGQLVRQGFDLAGSLVPLLRDADAEVRAQAARTLGDVRYAPAAGSLVDLLQDASPRVRLFAAEALGRLEHRPAAEPILAMLEANNDADTYLRHGGAIALARLGAAEPLVALAGHPSRALRTVAVVALRRMRHEGVARFLDDPDEYVVAEAARAIHDDFSIEAALPALARTLEATRFTSEPLLRRALSANLRVGTPEAASRVAAFAARPGAPEAMRAEAARILGVWSAPSVLDRVDGRYRGPSERDPALAHDAFAPVAEALLSEGPEAVQIAAAETAGRLRFEAAAPSLAALVRRGAAPDVRIAALEALYAMEHDGLAETVETALADRDEDVRMTALRLIPELGLPTDETARLLGSVLGRRSVPEQQAALTALGAEQSAPTNAVLAEQLGRLTKGALPLELHLDLMEAVEASGDEALVAELGAYEAEQPQEAPLDVYRAALEGGDPRTGRRLFYQHPAAQCVRCHMAEEWGGDVGPSLVGIARELSREELLESLVAPSARLAPGYGTVTLTLEDGQVLGGVLRDETDDVYLLQRGEGEPQPIPRTDVTARQDAPSSMPPMGPILTKRELRDLVAFLVTLRDAPPVAEGHGQ